MTAERQLNELRGPTAAAAAAAAAAGGVGRQNVITHGFISPQNAIAKKRIKRQNLTKLN